MSRRLGVAVAAALVASAPVVVTADETDASVGAFPEAVERAQRVAVFTDSVGLGAKDAIPEAFPDDWEVNVDGQPARFVGQMETQYIQPRLATNPEWFGDHVVIGAGYNFSYWDHDRFNREVDSLISTLTNAGVKHVHWVTLREVKPEYISASAWQQVQPYYWYFPTVNDLLEQALTRHPNLHLVDWAAVADQPGLTYDAIHLNNTGAALYSAIIRQSVDAVATTVPDGSTTRIEVSGGQAAVAAAINVTTTSPRMAGFITAHPCADVPNVSMHNYARAQIVAHSSIVALDDAGGFCLTTHAATNLIVDITGLFTAVGDFEPSAPTRWLDTRSVDGRHPVGAGDTVELDLAELADVTGLEATPHAVAVSVTATEADGPGFLRVTTCGSQADTSNVNFLDGSASPNTVIVELDESGTMCVFATEQTHVIVDLIGTFATPDSVVADAPVRWFDSREGEGEGEGKVAARSVTQLSLDDTNLSGASAVIVNITGYDPEDPGFVSAYPCLDGPPESSSLNLTALVTANALIVSPDDAGDVCFFSLTETHLIVDVMGSIDDSFTGSRPLRALDTRAIDQQPSG